MADDALNRMRNQQIARPPNSLGGWMANQQVRSQQQAPAQQDPKFDSSIADYWKSGNLAGMWHGANNNNAFAAIQGNELAKQQGNQADYEKYMKGLMGQNNVSPWQNQYQGQMNQTLQNMGNAPSTQQSANSWMQAYNPMMQQGGQMSFNDPQKQQTNLNPNAQNFMNGQSQTNQYGAPSQGAGGDIAQRIAQMGRPQGGAVDGSTGQNSQTAGNAWLQGLLSLQSAPGMSQQQMDTAASGIIDPTRRALGQKQEQDLSGLSNRGLGRSTAVSKTMGENAGILGDVTSRAYGDLTQQNIGLQNNNRLAALSGLGQAQGQYAGQGQFDRQLSQNDQNSAQNWLMNQGQLGMGLEGMNQQGQLSTNQLNQQAGNDAFGQNATRAGMGMDLYNQDANRAMQQQQGDRSWQTQTQGMQADNQYRNANMANDNMMRLLGMGANAGQQDFGNQQSMFSSLLGAGGLDQSAWGQNQNNLMQQLGMQGNMANSVYGNQQNAYLNNRDFMEQQRLGNIGLHRQQEATDKQGGIGGMLGQIGGTLLGSALGPLGASIGGKIGSSLFGGGQQQQGNGAGGGGAYSYGYGGGQPTYTGYSPLNPGGGQGQPLNWMNQNPYQSWGG